MNSLLLMLAAFVALAGWAIWRRYNPQRTLAGDLAFTALLCLAFGLALRFGGRTYPGIYFRESRLLNSILNGTELFSSVGYSLVLIGGLAQVLWSVSSNEVRLKSRLGTLAVIAFGLAAIIAAYGFYWALALERLA